MLHIFRETISLQTRTNRKTKKNTLSIRLKIQLFAVLIALLVSSVLSVFYFTVLTHLARQKNIGQLASTTRLMIPRFEDVFLQIENDLLILVRLPPIQGLARSLQNKGIDPMDDSTSTHWRNRLNMIFSSLISVREHYTQIRYISAHDHGRELVRVNRVAGHPIQVDPADLQSKANETYFREIIKLAPNQLYYSAITPNREHGAIEQPEIPTLRLATPIYDEKDEIFALLIINIDYYALIQSLFKKHPPQEDTYLIDQDQNYIFYKAETGLSNFFYGHQPGVKTPIVAELMNNLTDDEGTFESTRQGEDYIVHYLHKTLSPAALSFRFTVAMDIPKQVLLAEVYQIERNTLGLLGVLIAISLLIATVTARIFVRPINQIKKAIRRYEHGDLKLDLPVDLADELGDLARTLRNMTQRLSALRVSERRAYQKLESVIEHAVDGFITIDGNGYIRAFNPACEKMFGYEQQQILACDVKILMPDRYHQHLDHYLADYQQTGEKRIIGLTREAEGKRKDGTIFPIELSISEIHTGNERLFNAIIRDISERKRQQQEIEQLVLNLQKSNQELDNFAFIASHDLREPMRGIQIHAQKLLKQSASSTDDTIRRIQRINDLSNRLEKLIADLLYFSRLGRAELAYAETDLNHLLEEVRATLSSTLEEKHVKLIMNDRLPVIHCDQAYVKSIFMNLITNAIKYNDQPEKTVEIGYAPVCSKQKESVYDVLYVKDNGIGIEKEFHADIFRIFKRLNNEEAYGYGTGAGLTFVRKTVEKHGGTIWVDSALGQGSTFFFTLSRTERIR